MGVPADCAPPVPLAEPLPLAAVAAAATTTALATAALAPAAAANIEPLPGGDELPRHGGGGEPGPAAGVEVLPLPLALTCVVFCNVGAEPDVERAWEEADPADPYLRTPMPPLMERFGSELTPTPLPLAPPLAERRCCKGGACSNALPPGTAIAAAPAPTAGGTANVRGECSEDTGDRGTCWPPSASMLAVDASNAPTDNVDGDDAGNGTGSAKGCGVATPQDSTCWGIIFSEVPNARSSRLVPKGLQPSRPLPRESGRD